jgi:hypothetical protein
MQREIVAYAQEEMRNRGIEASARLIERNYQFGQGDELARRIRRLKRDPRAELSDWQNEQFTYENPQPSSAEHWG